MKIKEDDFDMESVVDKLKLFFNNMKENIDIYKHIYTING